jgi:hypothetical protein
MISLRICDRFRSNLLPQYTGKKGLMEALKEFTDNINDSKHIKVHLQLVHELSISKEKKFTFSESFRKLCKIPLSTPKPKIYKLVLDRKMNTS